MLGNLLQGVPLRIVESTAACTYTQRRVYAKRRAHSPRHHARINKKWLKRWGMRAEPMAYLLGGETLIVHPILAPGYRRAIQDAFPEIRA